MGFKGKSTGETGEHSACSYLEAQGYEIIIKNYKCRIGEIDVIARDRDVLCFIEVKTRRNNSYGPPYLAVTRNKQKQISFVALHFFANRSDSFSGFRFDVVSINRVNGKNEIELYKGAFDGTI